VAIIGARNDRKAGDRQVRADRQTVARIVGDGHAFAAFLNLDRAQPSTYGRIAVAPLNADGRPGPRALAGPACGRLAFDRRGSVCLEAGTEMSVTILDARLRTVKQEFLAGTPSRVRLSPDGRYVGITAFLTGHAYAAPGTFSTAATILDRRTGKSLGNIETDFRVTDAGKPITARDRNYWGITFAADGDTFYATAAWNGRTALIKGSVKARTAHTIHANVECPALSPDGTRIAYKKAIAENPKVWRFTVLDLATGRETPLAETRSIDDQLAWLDNGHVLYGTGNATWVVPADGSGKPSLWLGDSGSPQAVPAAAR
jgi:hypothetical protein